MIPFHDTVTLSEEEKNILLTLVYFDIFNYPLTQSEIVAFSQRTLGHDWSASLERLIEKEAIFFFDGFYSLHSDYSMAIRRKAGNELAQKKMKTAKFYSRIISSFPFVRSVMLSGSISKGYMDEKSDIDYFIVTAPGRLWLVRGAMAAFRRIFLFNSHKYFCTNYFIDIDSLEIEEKNLFTAIEACTLKPMFGKEYVYQFQKANQWCHRFLPNHQPQNGLSTEKEPSFKKIAERIVPPALLDRVDLWLMKKFMKHWRITYQHLLDERDFSIAFQSATHVSRSHPGFYQKRVLSLYEQKIREVEQKYGVSLAV